MTVRKTHTVCWVKELVQSTEINTGPEREVGLQPLLWGFGSVVPAAVVTLTESFIKPLSDQYLKMLYI